MSDPGVEIEACETHVSMTAPDRPLTPGEALQELAGPWPSETTLHPQLPAITARE